MSFTSLAFWAFFAAIFIAYLAVFFPQASIASESAVQQVGNQLVEASRVSRATAVGSVRAASIRSLLRRLLVRSATGR